MPRLSLVYYLVVLAFAAVASIASAKPAEPIRPIGAWITNFGAERCAVAREYPAKFGKAYLRIDPDPLQGIAEFALIFKNDYSVDNGWGRLRISVDGVPFEKPTNFKMYRTSDRDRIFIFYGTVGNFPSDRDFVMTLDFSAKKPLYFNVTEWSRARAYLSECIGKFWQRHGVTPEVISSIAHPAEAEESQFFSDEDYPIDIALKQKAGTTKVLIWVETDGMVRDCTVITSSHVPELDQLTCSSLRARAKYRPATDAQLRPVRQPKTVTVRWMIPVI